MKQGLQTTNLEVQRSLYIICKAVEGVNRTHHCNVRFVNMYVTDVLFVYFVKWGGGIL